MSRVVSGLSPCAAIARLLLLLMAATCSVRAIADGSIRLGIDSDTLFLGDVLVVEVESSGMLDPVDVTPLLQQTELVRETRGTRIAVVDGRVRDIHLRRMELRPRATGTLLLGPLLGEDSAGDVRSNSLAVTVQPPLTTDWQPGADALDLRVDVSTTRPRVGAQFLVEITLRHRYAIADERITLPAMTGFDVVPLVEGRRTFDPGNADLRRIQWRYLLHAREAGTHRIDALTWTGTLVGSRTRRGAFSRQTEPVEIQVRPLPVDWPGSSWWLPVESLTLSEHWSAPVIELDAGDEVIRTVTLVADGTLAERLPEIEIPPTRGLTITPLSATRETGTRDDSATATAVFTYRVTADSPVPVFLDTVRVVWWDTLADAPRESILPARRINVGLPEDANVLVERALAGDLWQRIRYGLSGIGNGTLWLHLAALVSVLAASALWLRWYGHAVFESLRARWQRHRHRRHLQQALDRSDWARVESLLRDAPAREIAADDGSYADRERLRKTALMARYAPESPQPD